MHSRLTRVALGAALFFSLGIGAPATEPSTVMLERGTKGPLTGRLPSGGTYIVSPSPALPVAAIALWFRAPQTGFETTPKPGIARVAATAVAGSVPITGTPLGQLVSRAGGRIGVATYPGSVSISAIVPAASAARIVRAMTSSFFTPVLTAAGLQAAQKDVGSEAQLHLFAVDDQLQDALQSELFSDGPARYPGLPAVDAVRALTLENVKSFATRAFRPQNAVLIVTGDVDAHIVDSAVPGRTDGAVQETALTETPALVPVPVDRAAIGTGFGYGWSGPPIASDQEATALDFVADYLFRPETGTVARALAASTTSLNGKFVTYHDPGIFLVTASGGDLPAARTTILAALAAMQQPLDAATFARARDAFVYHIRSDLQTPTALADTFGWYSVEGNPGYAPGAGGLEGTYFRDARSLTPDFVAATALRYLAKPGATVAFREKAKSS